MSMHNVIESEQEQIEFTSDPGRIRISAVIPTYNRGSLIQRAVDSALSQSYPPSEVVVVDDGSQDDTGQRLSQYDALIKYVYQENTGVPVARNRGVWESGNEWIAFLDSDDIWDRDHLLRIVQAITATNGLANYYFANTIEAEDKKGGLLWAKLGFVIDEPYKLFTDGTDPAMMPGRQPMMLQSAVFKKNAIMECGGFISDLRLMDDTHLFFRLGLRQPVCAVSGCGAIMSSDDMPENRLSHSYVGTEAGTTMRVKLFEDLLQSVDGLPVETEAELRRRLGSSLRVRAKQTAYQGDYLGAANYVRRAFAADPKGTTQKIWKRS